MNIEKIELMGSTAIAGDNPAGSKVDYADDFQQLKELLRKFGPGPKDPGYSTDSQRTKLAEFEDWRWQQIIKLGSNILSTKSKDLRIAAYVTRGLLYTQGLEGLQLGFSLCVKLLQNFPDLFPVKPKQRENAINWLTDNIQSRLDDAADIENLLQVQTELDALVEVVQQRLSPEVNPLNKLVKRIRERVEQTGAIDGGEEGEGRKTGRQEAVVGPKTETAVTAAPASRSVPVGAIADRTQAFKQLEKIAVFLEKTEPHSPVHMLLRKAVAWGGLSMQEVLAELLADQNSAREHVWEMLGLKEEDD